MLFYLLFIVLDTFAVANSMKFSLRIEKNTEQNIIQFSIIKITKIFCSFPVQSRNMYIIYITFSGNSNTNQSRFLI